MATLSSVIFIEINHGLKWCLITNFHVALMKENFGTNYVRMNSKNRLDVKLKSDGELNGYKFTCTLKE